MPHLTQIIVICFCNFTFAHFALSFRTSVMRNSHYHQWFCFVTCMDKRLHVKVLNINVVVSGVRWAENLFHWLSEPILHLKFAGKHMMWSNNTNGVSAVPVMVLFTFGLHIMSVTYFESWIMISDTYKISFMFVCITSSFIFLQF